MEIQALLLSLSFLSPALLGSTNECEREIPGRCGHKYEEHPWFTCVFDNIACCTWDIETPSGLVITLIIRVYPKYTNPVTMGCNRVDIDVTNTSECSAVYHDTSCRKKALYLPKCTFRWNNTDIVGTADFAKYKNNGTAISIPGWIIMNGVNATFKYKSCSKESDIIKTTATSVSAAQSPITHLVSQNGTAAGNWTQANKTTDIQLPASDLGVAMVTVGNAFFYGTLATACTLAVILVAAVLRYWAKKCHLGSVKIIRNSEIEGQKEEKISDDANADVTQVALSRADCEEITLMSNSRAAYEVIHGDGM